MQPAHEQPTAIETEIQRLAQDWQQNPRWRSVTRPYRAHDVLQLRRAAARSHAAAGQVSAAFWTSLQQGAGSVAMPAAAVAIDEQGADLAYTFGNTLEIADAGFAAAVLDVSATPSRQAAHLAAARLAADVRGVPLVLIARVRPGDSTIAQGYACATYADLLWYETETFDPAAAQQFAQAMHRLYPNLLLGYCCTSTACADELARGNRDLLAAGFSVVASSPLRQFTPPVQTGALPAEGDVEQIILQGLERGASPDLRHEIFSDETVDADLL